TSSFGSIYTINSGYNIPYQGPWYAGSTSGFNGITSNNSFLATSDGRTLMKRNINTGALIKSTAIPGGVVARNSGILINGCNIFAGSQTAVYEYDTAMNIIDSI